MAHTNTKGSAGVPVDGQWYVKLMEIVSLSGVSIKDVVRHAVDELHEAVVNHDHVVPSTRPPKAEKAPKEPKAPREPKPQAEKAQPKPKAAKVPMVTKADIKADSKRKSASRKAAKVASQPQPEGPTPGAAAAGVPDQPIPGTTVRKVHISK